MLMCRPDAILLDFVEKVFGVKEEESINLPMLKELECYSESEQLSLVQVRVLSFAKNTWMSNINGFKPYIEFCKNRNEKLFPVNLHTLDLCCINLAMKGKSSQVVDKLINAVIFASKFLGFYLSKSHFHIKTNFKVYNKNLRN